MKNRFLFITLLLLSSIVMAQVPDTNTFSQQDVTNVVGPNNLSDCFTNSYATYFNSLYGSKTMNPKSLYGFRDYGPKFTVSTISISSITSSSFTANCEILDCEGITVTSRGVVWATHTAPTTGDNSWANGSGCGPYSVSPYNVSGSILPNTTYYVKAYAVRTGGEVTYGNELSFTTLPVSSCPEVGDVYGGGIVAYLFVSGDYGYVAGECHGIIAAPIDQSAGVRWYNGTNVNCNVFVQTVGYAKSNTEKIVAAQGAGTYAASICNSLVLNGYSDWYLPTVLELTYHLYPIYSILGLSITGDYWSSSEAAVEYLTKASFTHWNGGPLGLYTPALKSNTYRVRAIRYF